MVVHKAIEVQNHAVAQDTGAQRVDKPVTVVIIAHNDLAFVGAQGGTDLPHAECAGVEPCLTFVQRSHGREHTI